LASTANLCSDGDAVRRAQPFSFTVAFAFASCGVGSATVEVAAPETTTLRGAFFVRTAIAKVSDLPTARSPSAQVSFRVFAFFLAFLPLAVLTSLHALAAAPGIFTFLVAFGTVAVKVAPVAVLGPALATVTAKASFLPRFGFF